jgi:hypothetical protein
MQLEKIVRDVKRDTSENWTESPCEVTKASEQN